MNKDALDRRFMGRAIDLANKGLFSTDPNPRVGCVFVKDGQIIAEGWHEKAGQKHAEIMALENAQQDVSGSTCYITLEPCSHHGRTSPCSEALIEAGISRLVVAMKDPNPQVSGQGFAKLEAAGIVAEVGLMAEESHSLNPGFIKRMETGMPWVTCKLGMSIDGRTAMSSGESQWITCKKSRQDVQLMRARSSAIITGSGTVIIDDPSMNARKEDFPSHYHQQNDVTQPWRVIMDSHLSVDPAAKIFKLPGKVIWVTTTAVQENENTEQLVMLQIEADHNGKVRPDILLKWLADQGCNEVMIEAGATLSGAFINDDLVDRLVIYMAPKILGDEARGLLHLPGMSELAQAKKFKFSEVRMLDSDICLTYARE